MNIAMVGAGNVATALAAGWLKAGHTVVLGVRDPQSEKTKKAVEQLPGISLLSITDAVAQQDIIVIATPPDAIHDLIPQLGNVEEKIIIDTTNAFRTQPE